MARIEETLTLPCWHLSILAYLSIKDLLSLIVTSSKIRKATINLQLPHFVHCFDSTLNKVERNLSFNGAVLLAKSLCVHCLRLTEYVNEFTNERCCVACEKQYPQEYELYTASMLYELYGLERKELRGLQAIRRQSPFKTKTSVLTLYYGKDVHSILQEKEKLYGVRANHQRQSNSKNQKRKRTARKRGKWKGLDNKEEIHFATDHQYAMCVSGLSCLTLG